jgi:HK97 family phage prohead protease
MPKPKPIQVENTLNVIPLMRGETPGLERRIVNLERCEVRTEGEGENAEAIFTGYAAVFNELSVDLGGFRERIAPGCFATTLAGGADIRLLFNHNPDLILGRTAAGNVTITEDERGLKVEAPFPDTSYARDLQVSMARGDVNQMSFGFQARSDSWEHTDKETGLPIRELLVADLFDVSPVCFPAYPSTTSEIRSHAAAIVVARNLAEPEAPEAADEDGVVAEESEEEQRVGKVLSEKNKTALEAALTGLTDAGDALKTLLDTTEEDTPAVETNDAEPALERPDFEAFLVRAKATRDWDWGDDYTVYLLTSMISLGSSYMVEEEAENDDADALTMRSIVVQLTQLLAAEIGESDTVIEANSHLAEEARDRLRLLELSA